MAAVVSDVVASIADVVGSRIAGHTTATGMLRSYIEAVVGFIDANCAPVIALTEIMLGVGFDDGVAADRSATADLESILKFGQSSGEFRDFDPWVMATAVQRSVDGLPFALQADPSIDCAADAGDLATIFLPATTRRSS